jgi:protein-arginine kinase activator protein McsA
MKAHCGEIVMHHTSILARIESLREEIKLVQNQERFYRTVKRDSFEENVAHTRREIRLLEMQAELGKLQGR